MTFYWDPISINRAILWNELEIKFEFKEQKDGKWSGFTMSNNLLGETPFRVFDRLSDVVLFCREYAKDERADFLIKP